MGLCSSVKRAANRAKPPSPGCGGPPGAIPVARWLIRMNERKDAISDFVTWLMPPSPRACTRLTGPRIPRTFKSVRRLVDLILGLHIEHFLGGYFARFEEVLAGAAAHLVHAGVAVDAIVAEVAGDFVGSVAAADRIVPVVARRDIVAA